MKKTIYNVYVPMKSQEQCDRMKQLCIDNGLEYWNDECYGFGYRKDVLNNFLFSTEFFEYAVFNFESDKYTKVTEQEFIELLKDMKDES